MTDTNGELIVVPMSFLVNAGLFEKNGSIIPLTFKHLSISISYDEDDNQLLVLINGCRIQKWSIGISHHQLERGTRLYFDINNNQQYQLHIIIFRENLHSSKSLLTDRGGLSIAQTKKLVKLARQRARFFVPPSASSAKTRRLEALARKTLTGDEFDKLPKETIAAFSDARTLGQLRYDDKNGENKLSSKYAVANAPEPNLFHLHSFSHATPAKLRREPSTVSRAIELKPQRIDTCCWLDIADINHAMLKRGEVFICELAWPLENTNDRYITVISDLRDKTCPMLYFDILELGVNEWVWQPVMLTQADNKRWYFLCPIDGHRFDTLYLRENRFGSWQAQKLYHPSQRGLTRGRRAYPQDPLSRLLS